MDNTNQPVITKEQYIEAIIEKQLELQRQRESVESVHRFFGSLIAMVIAAFIAIHLYQTMAPRFGWTLELDYLNMLGIFFLYNYLVNAPRRWRSQ